MLFLTEQKSRGQWAGSLIGQIKARCGKIQPREFTEQLGVQAHSGVGYGAWVRSPRHWGKESFHSGPVTRMLRPQLGLALFPSIILYSDKDNGGP